MVEAATAAEEIVDANPACWQPAAPTSLEPEVELVPHAEAFKALTGAARAVVRTGEATALRERAPALRMPFA